MTKIKILICLFVTAFIFVPYLAYAAEVIINGNYNETTTETGPRVGRPTSETIYNIGYTNYSATSSSNDNYVLPSKDYPFNNGDKINCTGTEGKIDGATALLNVTCKRGWVASATNGEESKASQLYEESGGDQRAAAAKKTEGPNIEEYSKALFKWARVTIIIVVTAIFVIAGIIYMTSGGNPNRVSLAKRLLTGGISAILVLFLGEFFLRVIVGVNI
jgi:hypothetical protein